MFYDFPELPGGTSHSLPHPTPVSIKFHLLSILLGLDASLTDMQGPKLDPG